MAHYLQSAIFPVSMGHSRKNRGRRASQSKIRSHLTVRPVNTQPTRPVIVIVCDDYQTAVAYFTCLNQMYRGVIHIKVVRACRHGAHPTRILRQALDEKRLLKDSGPERSCVFALVDLEREPERRSQAEAVARDGEAQGVAVLLSDPCFEVWTLLHLRDTGEYFEDCRRVVQAIKTAWQSRFGRTFRRKSEMDFKKIIPLRREAVERAKARRDASAQSWTEVYKTIETVDCLETGQIQHH